MTRIILLTSGKGGVGKTTIASNLAYALTELGEDVIAVDANLTTPNLGLCMGIPLAQHTLHDVLRRETKLRNAVYMHPYGFKLIPASMSIKDLGGVDVGRLPSVTLSLLGQADYVIMDCSAGLGREATSAIAAADEIILVTNPDLPSVADALKTANLVKKLKKRIIGVVVNRIKRKEYELSKEEIEGLIEAPVIAEIPEDVEVARSIAAKRPVVDYNPNSPAAVEIRRLAHKLTGRPFKYRRPKNFRILERLIGWMT